MSRTSLICCCALFFAACFATESHAQTITVDNLVSGLNRPVFAGTALGDNDRLFILEQRLSGVGRIKIYNMATGTLNAANFLQIPGLSGGNEQGLLGLAFHPNYEKNGLFYVNITTLAGGGDTVIREYQRTTADTANASSARTVMTYNQPFTNHNGGWLAFGPDGYLYIGSGDGGASNDPQNNSQDITNNRLGKLMRIDPLGTNGPGGAYGIPADNPFVGVTGDDEIWCYGLRNPWRCSFDAETGDLFMGDVGQNLLEEIDVQPANSTGGENYGWKIREGTSGGTLAGAIDPIYDYTRGGGETQGFSVTGGYVYRGPIAALQGHYFFADYVTSRIWSVKWDGSAPASNNGTNYTDFIDWSDQLNAAGVGSISSFGEDNDHNLYIVDLGGQVYKVSGASFPVTVDAQKLRDGVVAGGSTGDMEESDDTYQQLDPSPTKNPVKQKIDTIWLSTADTTSPTEFTFQLEAKMIGGPEGDVTQSVRMWNYQTSSFELLDTRPASTQDSSFRLAPAGDLSRFVQQANREIIAQVVWESPVFAGKTFFWSIDVDEAIWPNTN